MFDEVSDPESAVAEAPLPVDRWTGFAHQVMFDVPVMVVYFLSMFISKSKSQTGILTIDLLCSTSPVCGAVPGSPWQCAVVALGLALVFCDTLGVIEPLFQPTPGLTM